jgi:hypothetical protein
MKKECTTVNTSGFYFYYMECKIDSLKKIIAGTKAQELL